MELQTIQNRIYEVRGQKVMLDFDLADLYEVETKVLNQAVKRNPNRFPERFMFRLKVKEWDKMRSQIVTASDQSKRNINATPFAFTEHGVTMLASVLRSDIAIRMNIAIVDAFISLKEFALNHKVIAEKIRELESKYDTQFKDIYDAINYLLQKDKLEIEQKERKRIGFDIKNT
ncbi:MAG: ORF6N domain-containing protein [Bacteroidales bacterium]|nr:ORF6N domain-containing protein [Bacteroidales bacterium]MCF8458357.1 ORF6N domain-containing protein [Bacteroidales bacterium]